MTVSVFDLFTIGIGPSSSHTVGPMSAGADFAQWLRQRQQLTQVAKIQVDLFGSLAATGRGHGTFAAVLLGLEGFRPETIQPDTLDNRLAQLQQGDLLHLGGDGPQLDYGIKDLVLRPLTFLPRHANGMRFQAWDWPGNLLADRYSYSIGGGFVVHQGEENAESAPAASIPFPFKTGAELQQLCAQTGLNIWQLALANEVARRPASQVRAKLLQIAQVMRQCRENALTRQGELPGGLGTKRRAPLWYRRLKKIDPGYDLRYWVEWVNLVALAVNEENASGGRVVTAPTNGAAGIIPAVLFYARHFVDPPELASASNGSDSQFGPGTLPKSGGVKPGVTVENPAELQDTASLEVFYGQAEAVGLGVGASSKTNSPLQADSSRQARDISVPGEQGIYSEPEAQLIMKFLLTAGAIGSVIKEQSSISGAEVGCQGEVGSASSMAAAGLAQVMGGSPKQICTAAEIAMEHHLGLTCDPIGGLVQVPCIERNAIAATTAVNAARMALFEEGHPLVSLDAVIQTMKKTGADMSTKYKETAQGGLAVTVVEC